MHVLREHVPFEELQRRFEQGAGQGYRLIGVRDESGFKAAAGFRIHTNTNSGRILYVDDLITVTEARSRGFGKLLNDHLIELARREGCATIELDSAVHRYDAHRFYLRERYYISAHHFSQNLKEDG